MPNLPKTRYQIPDTNRKGFTLIELLITIAILAIIGTLGIITYSQTQLIARDARRKQDLRAIAIALESFKLSQLPRTYPLSPATGTGWNYSTATNPWITNLDTNFMTVMPKDPTNTPSGTNPWATSGGFVYAYCANAATCHSDCTGLNRPFFVLVAKLENANDPETIAKQDLKWCDGSLLRSRTGWNDQNRTFAIVSP